MFLQSLISLKGEAVIWTPFSSNGAGLFQKGNFYYSWNELRNYCELRNYLWAEKLTLKLKVWTKTKVSLVSPSFLYTFPSFADQGNPQLHAFNPHFRNWDTQSKPTKGWLEMKESLIPASQWSINTAHPVSAFSTASLGQPWAIPIMLWALS